MNFNLTSEQTDDLRLVLDATLRNLSHEIADTDNWEYRTELDKRRDRLEAVRQQLDVPERDTPR